MSKTLVYIPLVLIALALLYVGFFSFSNTNDETEVKKRTEQNTTVWETKINEQAPVTIKVTPLALGDEEAWRFDITFDTHAGSLEDDPLKVATLYNDRGNSYAPLSWEGAPPGGHHREGTLIFNAIRPAPKFIELKIYNVGGVSERSFTWNLN